MIDSRHEAWMGTTALSASDYSHEIIRHSDLIVLIGHDVVRGPLPPRRSPRPARAPWENPLLQTSRDQAMQ